MSLKILDKKESADPAENPRFKFFKEKKPGKDSSGEGGDWKKTGKGN